MFVSGSVGPHCRLKCAVVLKDTRYIQPHRWVVINTEPSSRPGSHCAVTGECCCADSAALPSLPFCSFELVYVGTWGSSATPICGTKFWNSCQLPFPQQAKTNPCYKLPLEDPLLRKQICQTHDGALTGSNYWPVQATSPFSSWLSSLGLPHVQVHLFTIIRPRDS